MIPAASWALPAATPLASALTGRPPGADGVSIEPSCYSRLTNHWFCAQYLSDRRDEIVSATLQHLAITVAALVLALVLSFPLALLARRYSRVEAPVLAVATGLYTIPSLALLPLLVPFTGLSATTVVIGLALYALTVLVRSILDGLRGVPDEVREAGRGLGYGPGRLLLKVELPLAVPVIVAGLRVATVSTVALTTVGSLVSYGGLGNLIKDGVTTDFKAELATAAVLCVVMAILLDVVLVVAQRLATPWARGARR